MSNHANNNMSNYPAIVAEREKRLVAMGEMAANLAHEIRNPLGSMELYCSLLKRDLEDQPSRYELADHIHAGIRTLERIISSCLQFSRDIKPKYKTVSDTMNVINQAVSYARAQAEKSNITLHVEERGECAAEIDSFLVEQAIRNVVTNAVEASALAAMTSGCSVVVNILSDRTREEVWTVTINDCGVGISEENLERIFDPFFTTRQEGTGLGLAIVHSIVTAHGGKISVKSEIGEGTTFILEFPKRDA